MEKERTQPEYYFWIKLVVKLHFAVFPTENLNTA